MATTTGEWTGIGCRVPPPEWRVPIVSDAAAAAPPSPASPGAAAAASGAASPSAPSSSWFKRTFSSAVEPAHATAPVALSSSLLYSYLAAVPAAAGWQRCILHRTKPKLGIGAPYYKLTQESTGAFIAGSKKRDDSRTSNYMMVADPSPDAPTSRKAAQRIFSKVRGNWSGTGYTIYDGALKPEKAKRTEDARCELGVFTFHYDDLGPGMFTVHIPRLDAAGNPVEFRPLYTNSKGITEGSLEEAVKFGDVRRYLAFKNRVPYFEELSKSYVLEFDGRVPQPSVKNFQLILDTSAETGSSGAGAEPAAATDPKNDYIVLQFGRLPDDTFFLDFRHPLSYAQAFGIVLASLDPKLADSRSFEAMRSK